MSSTEQKSAREATYAARKAAYAARDDANAAVDAAYAARALAGVAAYAACRDADADIAFKADLASAAYYATFVAEAAYDATEGDA